MRQLVRYLRRAKGPHQPFEGLGTQAPEPPSARDTQLKTQVGEAARDLVSKSGYFDPVWYASQYGTEAGFEESLDHYLTVGWRTGFSPGPLFDAQHYLRTNPDVSEAGVEPLEHYLRRGRNEGRLPSRTRPESANIITSSGLFDVGWYSSIYREILDGKDPLDHYLTVGWKAGCSPGPDFDVRHYLEANPDVAAAGVEPLEHYLRFGALEGRATSGFRQVDTSSGSLLPVTEDSIFRVVSDEQGPTNFSDLIASDPFLRFVSIAARKRHVLEIGFSGTSTLERVVAAVAIGAISSRVLAQGNPRFYTARLLRVAERLGLRGTIGQHMKSFVPDDEGHKAQTIWSDRANKDWIIRGSMEERDIKNKIGPVDLVVAPAVVYHAKELLQFIQRLRFLSARFVLFDCPIVESFNYAVKGRSVHFGSEEIWYAGAMDEKQASAMAWYWKERDVLLEQFVWDPEGRFLINTAGSGVWWWFVGDGAIGRLLDASGLRVVETVEVWGGRSRAVLAEKR